MVIEIVDPLKVVLRIRNLARDYDSRPIIVRRGVLLSLLNFIQSTNIDNVQTVAAEALKLLSSHPDNKLRIAQEPNLVETLCHVASEVHVQTFVVDTITNLSSYLTTEQRELCKTNPILGDALMQSKSKNKKKRKKKRNVVFRVEPMNTEESRHKLKRIILSTKGTISYTLSAPDSRVNIYTRTKTERFVDLFSRNGFKAVVLSDAVCESEYEADKNDMEDKENQKPQYLDPEKRKQQITNARRSLARTGDSLQARLAKRKAAENQNDDDEGTMSRIFSRVTSYFW
mmetsp:Transcript_3417/g.5036  ORF Transcript_3417/g.5036 Transcript_3417/m.5036 type:complete len:286 (+) Transcript_3417:213-1070(+)